MKGCILSIVLLTASLVGLAQNTDTFRKFDIGPFEVLDEDNNYRLRDGVNIPEYFELKRPMGKNSFHADLFVGLRGGADVNTYGIDFIWKRNLFDCWFLNLGISAAIPSAKSCTPVIDAAPVNREDALSLSMVSCYLGVPVTLEYMWGKNSIVSGYFDFGLTPGMCFIGALGIKNEKFDASENYADYSLFMAPRVDLGFYAPVGRHYLRAGILVEYKIAFAKDSTVGNMFKCGIGCFMPGLSLGLVF